MQQIPIIDDGEWSDRDEAEGDEDELEYDDEDDMLGDLQPARKKQKAGEQIPGLGDDDTSAAAKNSQQTPIKQ